MSTKSISSYFGKSAIANMMSRHRAFFEIKDSVYWTEIRITEASELWASGKTDKEIGSHFGKSPGVIRKLAHKNRDHFPVKSISHGGFARKIISQEDVVIEDPPKDIPIPEGALKVPYDELPSNGCQWSLGDFWDKPSDKFICCGLPIDKNRFCEYHAKKGVI